jgi:hypothetical protein
MAGIRGRLGKFFFLFFFFVLLSYSEWPASNSSGSWRAGLASSFHSCGFRLSDPGGGVRLVRLARSSEFHDIHENVASNESSLYVYTRLVRDKLEVFLVEFLCSTLDLC